MVELIDSHAHLEFPQFDDDRKAMLDRARAAGVEGSWLTPARLRQETGLSGFGAIRSAGDAFIDPLMNLTWAYGFKRADGTVRGVDIHAVAREINGSFLDDVESGRIVYTDSAKGRTTDEIEGQIRTLAQRLAKW